MNTVTTQQVAYKNSEGKVVTQTYDNKKLSIQTNYNKSKTNYGSPSLITPDGGNMDRSYQVVPVISDKAAKPKSPAPSKLSYSETQEEVTTTDVTIVDPTTGRITQKVSSAKLKTLSKGSDIVQQNPNMYPVRLGRDNKSKIIYDYTIDIQSDILNSIKSIKRNLNIPSAYTRLELNKLFHTSFNRFRVQYPDYFMNNTLGFVFFTRPDLHLFYDATDEDDSPVGDVEWSKQIMTDPQLYYIIQANPETAKTLTKGYSSEHYFNPLLANTVMSLDVSDESIDTLETGETFTGFKTQYAKSNIRSMTAGTISITFPETYNVALTQLHQLWCGYESGVYRGVLKPKQEYIWGKELDYACDIYYFLVDAEDMILRYWCKYTGCFPLNVNKSIFSFSGETQINHPSLNVTYAYFAREDMSLINLNEFNNHSSGVLNNFTYKANYIPDIGGGGETWSGPPFVQKVTIPNGFLVNSTLYKLRYKPNTVII